MGRSGRRGEGQEGHRGGGREGEGSNEHTTRRGNQRGPHDATNIIAFCQARYTDCTPAPRSHAALGSSSRARLPSMSDARSLIGARDGIRPIQFDQPASLSKFACRQPLPSSRHRSHLTITPFMRREIHPGSRANIDTPSLASTRNRAPSLLRVSPLPRGRAFTSTQSQWPKHAAPHVVDSINPTTGRRQQRLIHHCLTRQADTPNHRSTTPHALREAIQHLLLVKAPFTAGPENQHTHPNPSAATSQPDGGSSEPFKLHRPQGHTMVPPHDACAHT